MIVLDVLGQANPSFRYCFLDFRIQVDGTKATSIRIDKKNSFILCERSNNLLVSLTFQLGCILMLTHKLQTKPLDFKVKVPGVPY